ncbi:MAG: hypothetical protein M3Z54_11185 [Gemmatimonadota bacterium]|nr:hypothetical protein [Gemmatimonadota bacterium]
MRERDRDTRAGLYAIVCLPTGREYVGSSYRLLKRFHYHRTTLRHGKHHNRFLQREWDTHGGGAFDFRVLAITGPDPRYLLECEDRLIASSIASGLSMNAALSATTTRHSDGTRAKIREALRKSPTFAATLARIGKANRGKKRTPEMRKRQSERMMGHKRSPVSIARHRETMKGIVRRPEWGAAISAAKKGKKFTEAHRAALRAAHQCKRLAGKA